MVQAVVELRMDTIKLSNMVTASFGDGRNLIEGKTFIKDEAKVASRVGWCKVRICVSCQVAF